MAGFTLRKSQGTDDVEEWTISSETVSVGDLLMWTAGTATATVATASAESFDRVGVAIESATTSDTTVKVIICNLNQTWEVETANNSSSSDNGDAMILTDKNTVNNTGTNSTASEALVIQLQPVGAAADKKILVRFTNTMGGLANN